MILWMGAATLIVMLGARFAGPARTVEPAGTYRTESAGTLSRSGPSLGSGTQSQTPPPATGKSSAVTGDSRFWGLGADELSLPLAGLGPEDLYDTFEDARGEGARSHEALDIMAPRGTPVLAMADGPVKKLFTSEAGGLTVYQFGTSETYCYYYAHLDRYADSLVEGKMLKRGDVLGYAGSTGNASPNAPHLHLAIFRLGPEKNWWEGVPINPYPILKRLAERQTKK